jgi:hypothetical protein
VGYAASGASFGYSYVHAAQDGMIQLALDAPVSEQVDLHVLLTEGSHATTVTWEGEAVPFETVYVEGSPYVDATRKARGTSSVEIRYERS